ncbi:MAG: DUF72 domain-containing protein [Pseudomonadota bacterium]
MKNQPYNVEEPKINVGTAGWGLPRATWPHFLSGSSHLERYSSRFNAVEINSSFYRPHRRATYEKWAASVPTGFCFSVKLPKAFTHELRLDVSGSEAKGALQSFFEQVSGLKEKFCCLLIQLPPSLPYSPAKAMQFFKLLRDQYQGVVAVEPRNFSWFGNEAEVLFRQEELSRVLADPVLFDAGRWPGGDPRAVYLRLHGSPRIYYSAYGRTLIQSLATRMRMASHTASTVWCVFDNTASGAATADALYLNELLKPAYR